MRRRDENLGYPDPQEMRERMVDAVKGGAKRGGATGALLNGFVESRRISREFNVHLHPTDAKRRAYYDQKRKSRE